MPYVPVPKDISKVKTKVAFNLTKRQLICFSIGGAIGLPMYFVTRSVIGNTAALLLMIGLMLPAFFIAMYEKDGQPAEKVLRNMIRSRFYWPQTRLYQTNNFYRRLSQEEIDIANKTNKAKRTRKTPPIRQKGSPSQSARTKKNAHFSKEKKRE